MKRTILYSSKGKKLYAERRKDGRFSDIQTYARAHATDIRQTAKGEKRQRLIDYISAFAVQIAPSVNDTSYNKAIATLLAKIDKLKLF